MATLDKLVKTVESLRLYQSPALALDQNVTQKEKMAHCNAVADTLCTFPRTTPEFSNYLTVATEMFFGLIDDPNADVRLLADDSLTRVVKCLCEAASLGRMQVELYKEIKKNGSSRRLRSALVKFSAISGHIKPSKCRAFVVNLLPCLVKIAKTRTEESVHETLAECVPKLFRALGNFTNDNEIRLFLQTFLVNAFSPASAIRRSTALSLSAVAAGCRRPAFFLTSLLGMLLDKIIPIVDVKDQTPVNKMVGVMVCARQLIIPLAMHENDFDMEKDVLFERVIQLYELCLHQLAHADQSVVTHSLETLQQLLTTPPTILKQILVSPVGIQNSHILFAGKPDDEDRDASTVSTTPLDSMAINEIDEQDLDVDVSMTDHQQRSASLERGCIKFLDTAECSNSADQTSIPENVAERQPENDDDAEEKTSLKQPVFHFEEKFVQDTPELAALTSSSSAFFSLQSGPGQKRLIGNVGRFTDKDVPLIYCARKLTAQFLLMDEKGELLPDHMVRVSLKTLAMNCLTSAIGLAPKVFLLTMYNETNYETFSTPLVRDVANYTRHSDPQLKGAVVLLLGQVLKGALVESGGGNLDLWYNERRPDHMDTMNIIQDILADELVSPLTVRHLLASLRKFIKLLLESSQSRIVIHLLRDLCSLPTSSKNNCFKYWLVRSELCAFVSNVPFMAVYHITERTDLQDKFLAILVNHLLGDEDARVREAASKALVEVVPKLYWPLDSINADTVTAAAVRMATDLLQPILDEKKEENVEKSVFDHDDEEKKIKVNKQVASVVFRLVNMLHMALGKSTSLHMSSGCFDALNHLAKAYPPKIHSRAWGCIVPRSNSRRHSSSSSISTSYTSPAYELLSLCHSHLSTNSLVVLDVTTHATILSLTSRILSGLSSELLKSLPYTSGEDAPDMISVAISHEEKLDHLANQVMTHCYKTMSIFAHILDSSTPPPATSKPGNAAGTSVPTSASVTHPTLSPVKKSHTEKTESTKVLQNVELQELKQLGNFSNSHHYLKMYESLKSMHSVYRHTLDNNQSGKNCGNKLWQLVRETLGCLSSLLEYSIGNSVGKYTEELLGYLKVVFSLDPLGSLAVVQSLLRCIFRTNKANNPGLQDFNTFNSGSAGIVFTQSSGLFYPCFDQPYNELVHTFHLARESTSTPDRSESSLYCSTIKSPPKSKKKSSAPSSKSKTLNERANLAAYVRLFEPMVIKAMKHFTVTCDVRQQSQVLQLLVQLVKLRVNYYVLDAERIFVSCVLKLLEYIEEGQINDAHVIIPAIFRFLVLLSCDKYHSKPIIDIPKILQLCEGMFASGQNERKYVVPALLPVAEDLFCQRSTFATSNASESAELDAQREVMLTMLLKLMVHPEVLELMTRVTRAVKAEGDDRWRKISRTLTTAVIAMLEAQKIHLDDKVTLDLLHRFFAAQAPGTLRPVDPLLSAVLTCSVDLTSLTDVQRWLGFIVVSLPILTNQSPEEGILARLEKLGIQMSIATSEESHEKASMTIMGTSMLLDTSTDSSSSSTFDAMQEGCKPEVTVAKFLLRVIGAACTKFHQLVFSQWTDATTVFLQQELAHLLLFVIYMFQSGRYYRVTKAAQQLAKQDASTTRMLYSLDFITEMFVQLSHVAPFLTLQWCYILKLIRQNSCQSLWAKILQPPSVQESACLNYEVLRKGGVVLLCDYLCENITNVEDTTWLIVNYIQSVVACINESPVQEFVMSVHRSASSSGLLLQSIITRVSNCGKDNRVDFLKDVLVALEHVHPSHSGKLVSFLVNKFLVSPHLSLTSQANLLACNLVENLLLHSSPEEIKSQLTVDELASILETLRSKKLTKRFGRLVTLLNRTSYQTYQMSPIDGDNSRTFNPGPLSSIKLDRDWLLGQVKSRCCLFQQPTNSTVCAKMLASLDDNESDIMSIMTLKDFNLSILSSCLEESCSSTLQTAACQVLMTHIKAMVATLPKPLCLFKPHCWTPSNSDSRYSSRLETSAFHSEDFRCALVNLLPAFKTLLLKSPFEEDMDFLSRFALLAIEYAKWLVCDVSNEEFSQGVEETVTLCLSATSLAFSHPSLVDHMSSAEEILFPTSTCICLVDIVELRFPQLSAGQVPMCPAIKVAFEEGNETSTMLACMKLNDLLTDLLLLKKEDSEYMPKCWLKSYKNLVIGLARLPVFTSYVRIPPELWTMGWSPDLDTALTTRLPPIPVDYLQDADVLKAYVARLTLLGWTCRTQFEETWMSLLGVLSISKDDLSDAEVAALAHASSLVVHAITSLLLETCFLPYPGNTLISEPIHHPRDMPSTFLLSKRGHQLNAIQNVIHQNSNNYLPVDSSVNLDRGNKPNIMGVGQVSVAYIQSAIRYNSDVSAAEESSNKSSVFPLQLVQREDAMTASGLDIKSCLHFLFDLYAQWLQEDTPLVLLTDTVRSVLMLSDLFSDEAHFEWMLERFGELQKTHPVEDEILTNLLRIGMCKALAVLGQQPDQEMIKSLEMGIKSAHLPSRLGCLHSLLYLLQGDFEVHSLAKEYLQTYLPHHMSTLESEDHVSLMWALAFYLAEQETEDDDTWTSHVVQLAVHTASKVQNGTSQGIYIVVLTGLERLIVACGNPSKVVDPDQILKLSTDLLTESNPFLFIPAVQLFLACMYSCNSECDAEELDPEKLMQAMEQMSILFDCVRRCGVQEASLLCRVLPKVLVDFFPAADVMNRVINEFISPGQPHQVLLAGVLFSVFKQAASQKSDQMVQQWVLCALSNFTRRSPVSHSMWCLTVFFISAASDNPHLQAAFPHLQHRFGCFEHEDKKLFCLAARHFYTALNQPDQQVFKDTFKAVALPRTPYYDLLSMIQN